MPAPPESLRERKRRATMAAIEDAATELVLTHGFAGVTVDEICRHADISKRTFFNYVDSKEAAVVGSLPPRPGREATELLEESTGLDLLERILTVFLEAMASGRSGDGAHTARIVARRRAIFRAEPELAAARISAFTDFHVGLVDLVADHLRAHPQHRTLTSSPAAEAKALVTLVTAATNLGLATWLETTSVDVADLDRACHAALGHLGLLTTPYLPPTTSATPRLHE